MAADLLSRAYAVVCSSLLVSLRPQIGPYRVLAELARGALGESVPAFRRVHGGF